MNKTDAAAGQAQSGENESDPDLHLWLPASRVGEHILVSVRKVRREGTKTGLRVLVLMISSAWRKFAQRRRTARRSTAVAVDLPLFTRIAIQLRVLDGVERLWGHEQAPSKRLTQQQGSEKLLFLATKAGASSMDCSSKIVFFWYKFSQFSRSDSSRRAATQQTSSKFLVPQKMLKAHAILSVLVVLADAESGTEDHFQHPRPTQLTVSRTGAVRSIVAPLKLSGQ